MRGKEAAAAFRSPPRAYGLTQTCAGTDIFAGNMLWTRTSWNIELGTQGAKVSFTDRPQILRSPLTYTYV